MALVELPLRTERLLLRVLDARDLPAFVALRNDPDVARMQDWSFPYPAERGAALVAGQQHLTGPTPGEHLQVAIERDGDLLGDLYVHVTEPGDEATLGYNLVPSAHGQGYATEAARALLDALLAAGVRRVTVSLDPENEASRRVAQRLGFAFVERTEKSVEVRGEWVDDEVWRLDVSASAGS